MCDELHELHESKLPFVSRIEFSVRNFPIFLLMYPGSLCMRSQLECYRVREARHAASPPGHDRMTDHDPDMTAGPCRGPEPTATIFGSQIDQTAIVQIANCVRRCLQVLTNDNV